MPKANRLISTILITVKNRTETCLISQYYVSKSKVRKDITAQEEVRIVNVLFST